MAHTITILFEHRKVIEGCNNAVSARSALVSAGVEITVQDKTLREYFNGLLPALNLITTLEAQIADLKREHSLIQDQLLVANNKCTTLETQLIELKKENSVMGENLITATNMLLQSNNTNASLEAQIIDLKRENAVIEEKLLQSNNTQSITIDDNANSISGLEQSITPITDAITLADNTMNNNALEQAITSNNTIITSILDRLEKLEQMSVKPVSVIAEQPPLEPTPKKFRNWSVNTTRNGGIQMVRRISGKLVCRSIGNKWDVEKANRVIDLAEGNNEQLPLTTSP